MKLPREFIQLPLRFDAERLRQELESLPDTAWVRHPTDFEGNSSVRLISAHGGPNDDVSGPMLPTPALESLPYLRQVLASFDLVWSRSRLMRLAPGCGVPEHADINHHWASRVRVHIPIVTHPAVRFHCGASAVHMAAGEAWIFDNWRLHRVENPSPVTRVHLVADTSGSASFWQLVAQSLGPGGVPPRALNYNPALQARPITERYNSWKVMPPGELALLLTDLCGELEGEGDEASARAARGRFIMLCNRFSEDWRQLWSLYADSVEGRPQFERLRDAMRAQAAGPMQGLRARTNRVPAQRILEGRILRHVLEAPSAPAFETASGAPVAADAGSPSTRPQGARLHPGLDRPLFIVAAPRSGSSLLFETLACTVQVHTLGGEGHWLAEGLESLRPGSPGIDSNRLTAAHCSAEVERHVLDYLGAELRDAAGQPWHGRGVIRFLEKTPKNALRIPFLARLFPDALFVHLWRDPRENLASIIEAWGSGRWVTYPRLAGWDGPWSLLLPPGWRALRGASPAQVAAFQWRSANGLVLDDLAQLPSQRRIKLGYAELMGDPAAAVRRICAFAGLEFDAPLAARTAAPLPLAQHTHTPPRPEKWKAHQAEIEPLLPDLQDCWDALRA